MVKLLKKSQGYVLVYVIFIIAILAVMAGILTSRDTLSNKTLYLDFYRINLETNLIAIEKIIQNNPNEIKKLCVEGQKKNFNFKQFKFDLFCDKKEAKYQVSIQGFINPTSNSEMDFPIFFSRKMTILPSQLDVFEKL